MPTYIERTTIPVNVPKRRSKEPENLESNWLRLDCTNPADRALLTRLIHEAKQWKIEKKLCWTIEAVNPRFIDGRWVERIETIGP